jgi:hypothetical protein
VVLADLNAPDSENLNSSFCAIATVDTQSATAKSNNRFIMVGVLCLK